MTIVGDTIRHPNVKNVITENISIKDFYMLGNNLVEKMMITLSLLLPTLYID